MKGVWIGLSRTVLLVWPILLWHLYGLWLGLAGLWRIREAFDWGFLRWSLFFQPTCWPCSPGNSRVTSIAKKEAVRPVDWNLHSVPSATFCWSKQVTGQLRFKGRRGRLHFFGGGAAKDCGNFAVYHITFQHLPAPHAFPPGLLKFSCPWSHWFFFTFYFFNLVPCYSKALYSGCVMGKGRGVSE